jgi:hypothetical protein
MARCQDQAREATTAEPACSALKATSIKIVKTQHLLKLLLKAALLVALVFLDLYYRIELALSRKARSPELRIKSVSAGTCRHDSLRYAVFVYYEPHGLPFYTANALEGLAAAGVNVVVVANLVSDSARAQLLAACHSLIDRHNVGRDFGAYKDGVDFVLSIAEPERLMLLNDSVFWLGERSRDLVNRLAEGGDYLAATETYERQYHAGSFALSFSRAVWQSEPFRRFWAEYRLSNNRRHAIHNGEIKLTATLMRAGWLPKPIYTTSRLRECLCDLSHEEVLGAVSLLPSEVPMLRTTMRAERDRVARTFAPSAKGLNSLHYFRQAAIERIIAAIAASNQMSYGGLLFVAYLGMPILKRDLVYRGFYTVDHIEACLAQLKLPDRERMMEDFKRKGTPQHVRGPKRILYWLGMA